MSAPYTDEDELNLKCDLEPLYQPYVFQLVQLIHGSLIILYTNNVYSYLKYMENRMNCII